MIDLATYLAGTDRPPDPDVLWDDCAEFTFCAPAFLESFHAKHAMQRAQDAAAGEDLDGEQRAICERFLRLGTARLLAVERAHAALN